VAPVGRQGRNWRLYLAVLNLRVGQCQSAVVGIGKAGCVGHIADLQRLTGLGGDPQAAGAALQHDGCAWLVIGDGPMNPEPLGEIAHMIAGDDAAQRRYRHGPGTGSGALENLDVRNPGNLDFGSGLLHLTVERSSGHSIDFHLRVEQAFERARILAVHLRST